MCYKQCILEPINELDCENCIRTLCPRASDNFSCISAERDNKYFFCSNAENCTGPHSGAIPVSDKSCPSGIFLLLLKRLNMSGFALWAIIYGILFDWECVKFKNNKLKLVKINWIFCIAENLRFNKLLQLCIFLCIFWSMSADAHLSKRLRKSWKEEFPRPVPRKSFRYRY